MARRPVTVVSFKFNLSILLSTCQSLSRWHATGLLFQHFSTYNCMVARLVEGKEALLGMIAWECWPELLCVITASLGLSLHMPSQMLYKVTIGRFAHTLSLSLSHSISRALSLSVLTYHFAGSRRLPQSTGSLSFFLCVHPSLSHMRMCVNKHAVTFLSSKLTNRLCLEIYIWTNSTSYQVKCD